MLMKSGICGVLKSPNARKCSQNFIPIAGIRKITTSSNGCSCGCITCVCGQATKHVTKPYFQPRSALSTVQGKPDPLETILQNNRDWVKRTEETDPHFFEVAGSVHKPKFLYFGCSDARVPANLILGLGYV